MPQSGGNPDDTSLGKTLEYSCKMLATTGGKDRCISCIELKVYTFAYQSIRHRIGGHQFINTRFGSKQTTSLQNDLIFLVTIRIVMFLLMFYRVLSSKLVLSILIPLDGNQWGLIPNVLVETDGSLN
jgi:hypothetical protein